MRTLLLLSFLFVFQILNAQTNLSCYTMGSPTGPSAYHEIGYYFNNTPVEYDGCQTIPAIIIAVIDTSCTPWDNCNHNFGQSNTFIPLTNCPGPGTGTCVNRAQKYFIFNFNSPQMDSLSIMLIDSVPNGFYILAYTWFTDLYSNYPVFKSTFQALGATQITALPDTTPYIFFMKTGDPNSIVEIVGTTQGDSLTLNAILDCNSTLGIGSNYFQNAFSVFPNPAHEYFIISPGFENYKWELSDISGRQISKGKIKQDNKINFGKISAATYILTISDQGHTYKKIVAVK